MEADLKKFGLSNDKFFKYQEITKSFYNDLAKLYNLADFNTEMINSYGQKAIRAFYNGDKSFIDKIAPEMSNFRWQEAEELVKNLTDPQKAYVFSQNFTQDINNFKKVFSKELVDNATYLLKEIDRDRKVYGPMKHVDYANVLKNATNNIPANLFGYFLSADSSETDKIKYKYEDPVTNNSWEFALGTPKNTQIRSNLNNMTNYFNFRGSKYKHSNNVSSYFSWDKKFGIELYDKVSNESSGSESTLKYGFNFKEKFYFGHSFSSKVVDTDFKVSGKEISIETMYAASENVKLGYEVKQEHDDESMIPTIHMKSKIDLKNASIGEVASYIIHKPLEVIHNKYFDFVKGAITDTPENSEEEETDKSMVEEQGEDMVANENTEKESNNEIGNSANRVFESGIMDERSQQALDRQYQEYVSREVENIERNNELENSNDMNEESAVEKDQGYSV